MKILFFVLLFIILIIVAPFSFRIKASYNVTKNYGVFSLKFLFFYIKKFIFTFKRGKLVLITKKKKQYIELEVSNEQIRYFEELTTQFKDKIKIKILDFYSKIGSDDAFYTALLASLVNQTVSCIFAYIKNSKPSSSLIISTFPAYNENVIEFAGGLKFSISLFDLLYCFSMALFIRRGKYERI